jgi:hypothetical protein
VWDHLREPSPDVLLGGELVDLRERVVHAHEAELPVPEADPDGRRDEQRVELREGALRLVEEEGIVDRERGPTRDVGRELEVVGGELPSRLARAERDRAEQPATGRPARASGMRSDSPLASTRETGWAGLVSGW